MAIQNQYQKIVPFILFALALFLLFRLIKPTIIILLSSVLLAYVSFPVYSKIIKKIPYKSISIILSLIIVAVVVAIPFSFLTFEVTQQAYTFYHSLSSDGTVKGALFGLGCHSANSTACLLLNQAEKFSLTQLSKFGFDKQLKSFLPIWEEKITHFILHIPIIIGKIFLTLVLSYYILYDWENILKTIASLVPMRKKTKKRLIKEFGNIAHTVIYAQLFVAFAQGIVATIGFYLFGVPFALILGVITAFCALIPAVGTSIIWIPSSLFLILSGAFTHHYEVMAKGIGLFLYGLLIISTIDNILLAQIVKAKVKINPIVIITGVIGGAGMFGIMGIFIGPILLPLLITYFETFKDRFK